MRRPSRRRSIPASATRRPPRDGKKADPHAGDLLASKPGKGGAAKLPGTFTVRGTIKMCKNGKITVAAGRGPTVKAELANDVTIDVDMADLRAAQRDDRVTVNGMTTPGPAEHGDGRNRSRSNLANPLSGAKKHATRPAKTPAVKATAAPAPKAKKKPPTADDLLGGGK